MLVVDPAWTSHDATVKIWAYKGFVRNTEQVINDYPWQNWVDPDVIDED